MAITQQDAVTFVDNEYCGAGGLKAYSISFADENGDATVPNLGTVVWTLTDLFGAVINSRSEVALLSASTVSIVLQGDDTAFLKSELSDELASRSLVVKWEYNSNLGSDLSGVAEMIFFIKRNPTTSSISATSEGGISTVSVNIDQLDQRIAYDESDRAEYVGLSLPGQTADAAAWQIKRLTYDASGNVTAIRFADGTNYFDKVWDDRESYDYTDE